MKIPWRQRTHGLFTVTLDFGRVVLPGANRWLESGYVHRPATVSRFLLIAVWKQMKNRTTFTEPVRRVSCTAAALWLALAISLVAVDHSSAATGRTWTGGSATSGNWSTAANWSGGVAPVAGDILNFSETGARKTSNTNNFPVGRTLTNFFPRFYRVLSP